MGSHGFRTLGSHQVACFDAVLLLWKLNLTFHRHGGEYIMTELPFLGKLGQYTFGILLIGQTSVGSVVKANVR